MLEYQRIESCFFEATVYKEGVIMGAPHDALKYREELKEKYLQNYSPGTEKVVSVNLRPSFKDFTQQGWLVEAVVIKKPVTVYSSRRALHYVLNLECHS